MADITTREQARRTLRHLGIPEIHHVRQGVLFFCYDEVIKKTPYPTDSKGMQRLMFRALDIGRALGDPCSKSYLFTDVAILTIWDAMGSDRDGDPDMEKAAKIFLTIVLDVANQHNQVDVEWLMQEFQKDAAFHAENAKQTYRE